MSTRAILVQAAVTLAVVAVVSLIQKQSQTVASLVAGEPII